MPWAIRTRDGVTVAVEAYPTATVRIVVSAVVEDPGQTKSYAVASLMTPEEAETIAAAIARAAARARRPH